jgi:hypothetical protein
VQKNIAVVPFFDGFAEMHYRFTEFAEETALAHPFHCPGNRIMTALSDGAKG